MIHSLDAYQYDLPKELIAQYPIERRDHSRLMIVDRSKELISEIPFRELIDWVSPGDRLIFNNTKVIPARLYGKKETGARVEILLSRNCGKDLWEALVKPGRRLKPGAKIIFSDTFHATVVDNASDGKKIIQFFYSGSFDEVLQKHGCLPLPTYIDRSVETNDLERYQTIYAKEPGAIAAPTAGLHFTKELLTDLKNKNIDLAYITLHVGEGTFKPVKVDDIRNHLMHKEFYQIDENLLPIEGKEIVIGTTTCRALESAAKSDGSLVSGPCETDIFIYPGYTFKRVNSLLTNFHLPSSTLLMLVCALGGRELILEAYRKAVKERFRFFSYGDAMLII